MANYVYIENGKITEKVDVLPRNWRNISGLNLSANDDKFLNSHGWYKVNKEHINFNPETHQIIEHSYTIQDNIVTEIPIISEKTIESFENRKNNFLNGLREIRNRRLRLCDWTQLNDTILENQQEWIEYRQKLRDLPSLYEDNDIVNFDSINWPEPPQ